jgi:FkbH-like protein
MRGGAASLDDWIRDLHIVVTAEPLGSNNLPRAAQLLNKTNQMNLRTRRLAAPELLEWATGDGHMTWCVAVGDRLGDAGLTGLVSVERGGDDALVADFVLSCRVMGRRVEDAMLHLASVMGIRLGATRLTAEYLPTAKNEPCRRFFDGAPMVHDGAVHIVELASPVPPPPDVTIDVPSDG